MLFHSSEAIVGGSPYNRTQAELDSFLRSARSRSSQFAVTELGARPQTFREFHASFAGAPAEAADSVPA